MSKKASTKSLALFISNDSLTYLTKTSQENEDFYSEAIKIALPDLNQSTSYEQVEKIIKANLPLLLYYHDVKICYASTPALVVPSRYLADDLSSHLSLNHLHEFAANAVPLKQVDGSLVFQAYYPLNKVLGNLANFKGAKLFHTGKLIIDEAKIDAEKNQVFVRLIEQNLEICIYKKGTFVFYNVFNVSTDEDVVYYTLNTLEQIKLDPSHTFISLEGGISSENLAFEYLTKYIQSVQFNEEIEETGPKYLLYKIFECE